MTRIEIEKAILEKKETIGDLDSSLVALRDDLFYLYEELESSLREELTDVLAENEKMEGELKGREY